ncbi:hypothetical protein [Streptomyces platensis]|nr:hypothetical protein OG962_35255 [Streptomyces platensis]
MADAWTVLPHGGRWDGGAFRAVPGEGHGRRTRETGGEVPYRSGMLTG